MNDLTMYWRTEKPELSKKVDVSHDKLTRKCFYPIIRRWPLNKCSLVRGLYHTFSDMKHRKHRVTRAQTKRLSNVLIETTLFADSAKAYAIKTCKTTTHTVWTLDKSIMDPVYEEHAEEKDKKWRKFQFWNLFPDLIYSSLARICRSENLSPKKVSDVRVAKFFKSPEN